MPFVHRLRLAVARSCKRRARAVAHLVPCLWLLLSPATGRAQTDGETEVARQRFREGVAHYDRQDYEKARLAFLQAYLLKPHPAVLLNLAQSELRAGRHAEAAENFAKYIRENPSAPATDHAKTGFEEARQRVTELNVQVNATGASVSLDGAEVGRSPLPNVLYLMPGRHSIVARKGAASAEKVLDAYAGRREYIALELREGYTPPLATAESASAPPAAGATGAAPGTDDGTRQSFFGWLGSSPAKMASASVAGLALGTSAVLAGFASNRYAAANDAKSQILANLETHVAGNIFDSSSRACGAGSIAEGNAIFGAGATPEDQTTLPNRYRNACNVFIDRSDSGDRLKALSLVSLGVGVVATIGTIVWYFVDSGSSGDTAFPDAPSDTGRATLTPILSGDTQGLSLEMTF